MTTEDSPTGPRASLSLTGDTAPDGSPASPAVPLPARIGLYRVEAELGRGGMGVVYRACDDALRRPVALKVLRPEWTADPEARQRFVREAQSAARVRHDHVVAVYSVADPPDGPPYLVMELLAGPTLAGRLCGLTRIGPREAAEVCAQAADGLAAAHAAGLIHRDVKPANIIFDPAAGRAKVADFGLARPTADTDIGTTALTRAGSVAGTPAYMSPEQARAGALDVRTDVYGLGATLYECLTGEVPFRGLPHLVLRQILEDEPRPVRRLNDAVPRDLEVICQTAMAKEPEKRYVSATAFADDLRRWMRGEPIHARPAGRLERAWRWARRNPRVAGLTSAVAALLLLIAVGSVVAAVLIEDARRRAEVERQAAEEAGERAAAQRRLALESLNALIYRVEAVVGTQPGTLRLRQQLLETAVAGLEKVTREPDAVDADASTLDALDKLGDLHQQLGRTADARRAFERGRELAAALTAARPNDSAPAMGLAQAHDKLGNLDLYAGDLDAAGRHYAESRLLRERWVETIDPAYRNLVRRNLSVSLNKLGDVRRRQGDPAAARELYAESLRALDRMVDAEPQRMRRDRAFTYGRVGEAEQAMFDFAAARASFSRAHAESAALAAAAPTDLRAQYDVGIALDRLGGLALRVGDPTGAEAEYRRANAVWTALAEADPEHADYARALAGSFSLLGDALVSQGKTEEAGTAYRDALARIEKLEKADPGSMQKKNDLLLAYTKLLLVEERAGQFDAAAKSVETLMDACRRFETEMAGNASVVDYCRNYRQTLEADLALYRAAQAGDADRPERIATHPPALAAGLWRIRAAQRARAGDPRGAAEAGAALRRLGDSFMPALGAAALAYAQAARAIRGGRAAPSLPDADQADWTRYADAAVEALREGARRDPASRRSAPMPLELGDLYNYPPFQALLKDVGRDKP